MEVRKRRNRKVEEKTRLELALEKIDDQCRNCHPPTPLDCIVGCKVWYFRNELRQLRSIFAKEDYKNTLLNTLKNKRRLSIVEMLSKSSLSVSQLQKELNELGYTHSQETILNEYIEPLISTGLVLENSNHFRTTVFGNDVSQVFAGFHGIEDILPPHSECHEEKIIESLLECPKTYEELTLVVSNDSLKRAMARLLDAKLIETNGNNNYIFYFRTRRPEKKEKLSLTEKRVYDNIPEEGITGERLAEMTHITLRRTYKYIRKLKGKKLVFKRKNPKTYALTIEGIKVGTLLTKLNTLLKEFAKVSVAVTTKTFGDTQRVPMPDTARIEEEQKPVPILVKQGK